MGPSEDYLAAPINRLAGDVVKAVSFSTIVAVGFIQAALPAPMRGQLPVVFGLWMGGSTVASLITKTGAFEVFMGGKKIYSAIEEGHIPELKDLLAAFKKAGVDIKKEA